MNERVRSNSWALRKELGGILEVFGWSLSRWRWAGRKISDDSLSSDRKLVDLHDYLYVGGLASLLS